MLHNFVHGKHFAFELQKALKIDRPIRSVLVRADVWQAVSVTIEFVPEVDEMDAVAELFKKYQLIEVPIAESPNPGARREFL